MDRAILGAEFLTKFQLIIDMHNKKLIDGVTNLSIRSHIACVTSADSISTTDKKSRYANLLLQYPNLTKPNLLICNSKHNVKHYIATKGPPGFSKARQLDGNKLKLAKQEFKFMLENDIIRPSKSPWASPLHLVSKKDGSLRPCGDYRRLNAQTIPDRYPIPRIEDFHHILKQTKIFSKIDLFKAYFQIPISEDDKQKTAIIMPFGLYEFNVMSFGLRNAPSTFQRFINEVFFGLDFVFAYLDDILVASSTEDEHSEHLKVVFSRLEQYGLRINLGKSVTGVNQLEFLGYMITPEGSKPLPEKVNVILNYRIPETIHELRTFLGLINFYRRYIKDAAKNQAVLHEYLKCTKKKDKSKIPWTKEAKEKFEQCIKDLANATLLSFPNPDSPLALFTDASDYAVGSVLQQFDEDCWKPLAFFSKKFTNAQKGYSTYDRELLGIYFSIKQFKHILEGRQFTIYTDHKPLMFAFQQKNEKASPRQLRHLQYISEFSTDIRHIGGKENIVADSLSRIESISEIDYDKIADAQIENQDLNELRSKPSLHFKQYPLDSGKLLWCDISTTKIRPFIPQDFRMHIFQKFHSLALPGVKSTVKQIASRFIWLNIRQDITQWAKSCIHCQKNKINRHTRAQIATYKEVDDRFSVVHIDIIDQFPTSEGKTYCLTCIDRFTCWIELIPLANVTAETVAREFYDHWISRFGMPYRVITDQGSQFRSELFKNIGVICGFKVCTTTAFHPQCNGKIERIHRTLKAAIRAHDSIKWTQTLSTVLLGLRSALRGDTNYTIAQMVYGQPIRLPGEFFEKPKSILDTDTFAKELQKQMELLKPLDIRRHPSQKIFVHKDLHTCTHVSIRIDRVRKPLEPPYDGPFPVVKRHDKYFAVTIKGKDINISIDRLKPEYLLLTEVDVPHHMKLDTAPSLPNENLTAHQETEKQRSDLLDKDVQKKTTRSGRRVRFPARYKD
ncbi:Transposon Ty3-I Gag-Pol polyprotein [Araneus ventricosus]|uniref:RNA-directed DNA polymerase n=3 Tax=Araneus ventricosus TaxID=182803 RepID=A0A4Y2VTC0_ARAVE|nr:Transposon Ty3-I Gag-Pol polyprotein [Araneus ventricosus]GBO27476.1 Transposon Ty3-I Gag-Pol polyprotein [Araneus ventricosus]GBO33526.1 Transposon Ty3-I Gag-Pol polyprotein [Araneus ventricosus]GBO33528.1 Transposon Ty3-I Gag-Pol polyprotein [Araneus ventricosus]